MIKESVYRRKWFRNGQYYPYCLRTEYEKITYNMSNIDVVITNKFFKEGIHRNQYLFVPGPPQTKKIITVCFEI